MFFQMFLYDCLPYIYHPYSIFHFINKMVEYISDNLIADVAEEIIGKLNMKLFYVDSNFFIRSSLYNYRGNTMKKLLTIVAVEVLILSALGVSVISEHDKESLLQPLLTDEYDMVIIAPSNFSLSLQPLIDHKNSRDVYTILKTTEEIYDEFQGRDEVEQIKYFIKYALENWNITYVMTYLL